MRSHLKVYVDGQLRRVIVNATEMYMPWMIKGSEVDLIIEPDGVYEEYTMQYTGHAQIYMSKEGKIVMVTNG